MATRAQLAKRAKRSEKRAAVIEAAQRAGEHPSRALADAGLLAPSPAQHAPQAKARAITVAELLEQVAAAEVIAVAELESRLAAKARAQLGEHIDALREARLLDVGIDSAGQPMLRAGDHIDLMQHSTFARIVYALEDRQRFLRDLPEAYVKTEVTHRQSIVNAAAMLVASDHPRRGEMLDTLAEEVSADVADCRRLSRGQAVPIRAGGAKLPGYLHDHLAGQAQRRRPAREWRTRPGQEREKLARPRSTAKLDGDRTAKRVPRSPDAKRARRHARALQADPDAMRKALELAATGAGMTLDDLRRAFATSRGRPSAEMAAHRERVRGVLAPLDDAETRSALVAALGVPLLAFRRLMD